MTPDPASGGPPLARLFAIAYRLLIDGLHDRLQAQGWADVRPAYGFVLLATRDQPASVTGLASLMGMPRTLHAVPQACHLLNEVDYLGRAWQSADVQPS